MNTKTTTQVDPRTLVKGDKLDAGGTRRNATVDSVSEWGTGTVSVNVWSKGRFSQVWFKRNAQGELATATKLDEA